ncbi:MAG TPA: hypothetical protein VFS43_21750 [Polyangiaceae bacterium]|nr:hypothetical protein [Polyangiaceae bacterium]
MPAGAHRDVAVPRGGEVRVVCALQRRGGRAVNVANDPAARAELAGAVGELRVATLRRQLAREAFLLPEKVTTKAGATAREDFFLYLLDWAAEKTEGRPDEHAKKLDRALARLRQVAADTPCDRLLVDDTRCNLPWRHADECEWSLERERARAAEKIAPPRPAEAPKPAPGPAREIAPARPAAAKGPAAKPPRDPQDPWGMKAPEAAPGADGCARCRGVAFDGARWCAGCVEAVRASHPARAELEAEARGLRGHLEYALMGLDVLRDRGFAVRRADVRTALLAWAGEGGWAGDAVSRLRDAIEWAWRARGDADAEIDRLARRLGPSWASTVEKMKKSSPLWHAIPTLSAALARPPGADVPPPSPAAHVPPAACPCGAPAVFYDSIGGQMQRHLCRPCAEAAGYELAPELPGPGEPDALGFREGALGPDPERAAVRGEGAS